MCFNAIILPYVRRNSTYTVYSTVSIVTAFTSKNERSIEENKERGVYNMYIYIYREREREKT